MIDTIKRSNKGTSLSHEEFDSNWASIENAVNQYLPKQKYQATISAFEASEPAEGSNVQVFVGLQFLESTKMLPIIKCWAVHQGVVVAIGNTDDLFVGNNVPVQAGDSLQKNIVLEMPQSIFQASTVPIIYIEDSQGNFSNNLSIPPLTV